MSINDLGEDEPEFYKTFLDVANQRVRCGYVGFV